jgi:hypothetical protein
MNKSFFFLNASISRFILLSSHTSRNSRFNFFVLLISSIIKFRRSSFRNHHNLINNFLFISFFLLFDCFSFFNFAFFSNFSLFSIRLSSTSNLRKNQKSNSEKDQELNIENEQKFSQITREFNVTEKTQFVLKYMRKLRMSFSNFVFEVIKTNSRHRQNLIRKLKLLRFFVLNFNDVLNLVNWNREEYRKKLNSIFENKYFKSWKIDDINLLETNSTIIIKKIKNLASHLLALLRYITATIDRKFDRENMKIKWIIIIFILCFIFKSRTCVRWSTMWNIQLHANKIKRRVIQCLFHIDLTIEYKNALSSFRKLTRFQMRSLKTLNAKNKFIII